VLEGRKNSALGIKKNKCKERGKSKIEEGQHDEEQLDQGPVVHRRLKCGQT
jgi:hypothetical protein